MNALLLFFVFLFFCFCFFVFLFFCFFVFLFFCFFCSARYRLFQFTCFLCCRMSVCVCLCTLLTHTYTHTHTHTYTHTCILSRLLCAVQVVEESPFLTADVLEEFLPYSLIRCAHHALYAVRTLASACLRLWLCLCAAPTSSHTKGRRGCSWLCTCLVTQ